jgi:hypothetical protein
MERDFLLFYCEELDSWILSDNDIPDKNGNIRGTVLYVGQGLTKREQEDELLDLILLKNEKQEYYEEILSFITSEEN